MSNQVIHKCNVSIDWQFVRAKMYRTVRERTDRHKSNKSITMMRGKSPRCDVEMTKKLNFVAAILDF